MVPWVSWHQLWWSSRCSFRRCVKLSLSGTSHSLLSCYQSGRSWVQACWKHRRSQFRNVVPNKQSKRWFLLPFVGFVMLHSKHMPLWSTYSWKRRMDTQWCSSLPRREYLPSENSPFHDWNFCLHYSYPGWWEVFLRVWRMNYNCYLQVASQTPRLHSSSGYRVWIRTGNPLCKTESLKSEA